MLGGTGGASTVGVDRTVLTSSNNRLNMQSTMIAPTAAAAAAAASGQNQGISESEVYAIEKVLNRANMIQRKEVDRVK